MSISFEKSQTKFNLMKAFAGESQARNRYTFAASQAKKEGLNIVERAFTFTANQEKEHAELFYNHLSSVPGNNINIKGGYPVDIYNNTLDLLKSAQHNEYEEYNEVYKLFGDEAKSEGFEEVSKLFHEIAKIEKVHGDRFGKFIELMSSGQLFTSEKEEQWICLNCGHIQSGKTAPEECPVCQHNQGYQMRHSWIQL